MSQHLTVTIPDDLFATIKDAAQAAGSTPEQVVADWLAEDARRRTDDPVLKLLGCIDSDVCDVAERHDEYIGEGLMAETRRVRE